MRNALALLLALMLMFSVWAWDMPVAKAASGTISANGTYDIGAFGNGSTITINPGLTVTLTNNSGPYSNIQIVCKAGVSLTIHGLFIENSNDNYCALSFLGSDNQLILAGSSTLCSGDNVPGIKVEAGTELEILGDGSVSVYGGGGGAGIGAGTDQTCGTITISGGTVTAYGGAESAGVGGAYKGSGGIINISGGVVTAYGGTCGSGIGGAAGQSAGTINISGGSIDAKGNQDGAGIGGATGDGVIQISGGHISANSESYGAGIGGAMGSSGGSITIHGGTILANGGDLGGAGIGGGYEGDGGTILISGDNITDEYAASGYINVCGTGKEGSAGIGGGYGGSAGSITISGSYICASKGDSAPYDVGSGQDGTGGNLTLSGTSVLFLEHEACITPTTLTHTLKTTPIIQDFEAGGDKAYGFYLPAGWGTTAHVYLDESKLFDVTYNANGGAGTLPEPVTQYQGTKLAVAPGYGLVKNAVAFHRWNTENDGSGDSYMPGSKLTVTGDTVLYAIYGDAVPVSSVQLSQDTATMTVGDTLSLTATVLPEDASNPDITWSTSDDEVVTVDQNGLVTAVGLGTATITATADGKSDSCSIEVTEEESPFARGDGSESDPYGISTPEQLNAVRDYPNAHFIMLNDIDMTEATSEGGVYWNNGAGWEPINEFRGILDGGGHEISGLYSQRVRTSFIDTVAGSVEIKNLVLYDIDMLGEDGADGLCFENRGTISNCAVFGYITQTTGDIGNNAYDAGIAGINYGIVSDCWVEGTVVALSDSNLVGGVVAYNAGLIENSCNNATVWAERTTGGVAARNMGVITRCCNTGTVFSDYFETGGIAGNNYFGAEISDCYNIGRVYEGTAGGIAGKSGGTVSNCYNIGSVQGKSIVYDVYGGTVANCYAIERSNDIIELNAGVSHVVSLTNDKFVQSASFSGFDFDNVWTMAGDSQYPYPELQQIDMTVPVDNTINFAGGNGLPYNPYKIETAEHLNNARYFAWDWFELQNDIDLTEATRSGGDFYNNGTGWIPIGEDDYTFNGVFDGNGHAIIGLWMNNPDDGGLFAHCGIASTIKDLGVARADVKCNDKAGIIAINNGGDILRCYTSGKIYGWYAGGLVSENNGLISDCYTTASVSGEYIGGLVESSNGIVERCYNAGSVKGGYDIARSALLGDGCYHWKNDKAASGSEASDPGVELTEEEYTRQESFEYLNFDTVWTMTGNTDYPYPELAGLNHIEVPNNTVEFAGGNGLPYSPYLISNSAHLNNMRSCNSANFALLTDINLGGSSWVPFAFYGNLDGNDHVISNGNIIASGWDEGFFKLANYAAISNLGIENINIVSKVNSPTGTYNKYVGLLAGELKYSRITNCYATGSINCIRGESVGGFAGYSNSKIIDCYAYANIVGEKKVGGFIGYLADNTTNSTPEEFTEINNCFFVGGVGAKTEVGGFAGYTLGKVNISGCYSEGEIKGNVNVGGFIGMTGSNGMVSDCYSLGTAVGNQNTGAFVGNSDQSFDYDNCYWYSSTGTKPIGVGSTASISKINIPEINEVDINTPVVSSEITTNFALYGDPLGITFISTKDTSIAKIENQILRGVSLGNTEVNISIRFSNERTAQLNGYKTKITGIPSVTVPATGVTLPQTELYLHRFDAFALVSTVLPEDATNKGLIWESSDAQIASVNDLGVVTANQPGYATITVTTVDGGYTATCDVSVDTPTGISITSGNAYRWPGEASLYTAKVLPTTAANKTVIWSSSDESIAVVGETTGMVRAIAPGTATITAATEDGRFTDTAYMYVKQPVEGIEVTQESIEIRFGEKYKQLGVNVLPENAFNKNVSYASDKSGVASIDPNGWITGVSPGTATITVTTQDGGYTDSCIVTVLDTQPVTSVSLNTSEKTMAVTDSVTLIATVLPENATYPTVTWSTSNENVATVNQNGQVTAVSPGTATITATADGQSDTCTVTVIHATIQSSKYTIDRGAGLLKGVADGTTVAMLRSNLNNDGSLLSVYNANGQEITGGFVGTGMTVRYSVGGVQKDSLSILVLGDTNGDGAISVSDYVLVRLDILGLKKLNGTQAVAGDVDKNGRMDVLDYTLIRLDILGDQKING